MVGRGGGTGAVSRDGAEDGWAAAAVVVVVVVVVVIAEEERRGPVVGRGGGSFLGSPVTAAGRSGAWGGEGFEALALTGADDALLLVGANDVWLSLVSGKDAGESLLAAGDVTGATFSHVAGCGAGERLVGRRPSPALAFSGAADGRKFSLDGSDVDGERPLDSDDVAGGLAGTAAPAGRGKGG